MLKIIRNDIHLIRSNYHLLAEGSPIKYGIPKSEHLLQTFCNGLSTDFHNCHEYLKLSLEYLETIDDNDIESEILEYMMETRSFCELITGVLKHIEKLLDI